LNSLVINIKNRQMAVFLDQVDVSVSQDLSKTINPEKLSAYPGLFFQGANFKGQIKRAKGDQAGDQEDDGQNQQDDS